MSVMPADLPNLIRTHLPFVYACALRQTRDVHLAEDVTQAVFIILASKIAKLRTDVVLRDWLFVTTRFAAKNALKMESRRRYHERHAALNRSESAQENSAMNQELQPLLDDALAKLNATDRAGVLLSFFDNKTFREVGLSLGVSEEAARKRVARAIEKMRSFFHKRGVSANEFDVEQSLKSTQSVPGPSLVSSVTTAALLVASKGAAPTSALAIIKGVNHMIAMTKLKFAAAVFGVCLVVGGGGATIVASAWASEKPPAVQPAKPQPAGDVGSANFADGVSIEVAGVSKLSDDAVWWRADGSPCDRPCDPSTSRDTPAMTMAICLVVDGVPDDAGIEWIMPPNSWSAQPATKDGSAIPHAQIYTFNPNQNEINISCNVATGEWEDVGEIEGGEGSRCASNDDVSYALTLVGERNGKPLVHASYNIPHHQVRLVATDKAGIQHVGNYIFSNGTKSFAMVTADFDFPTADIAKATLQMRSYDHQVTIKHITMDPAKKTKVEIETEKK